MIPLAIHLQSMAAQIQFSIALAEAAQWICVSYGTEMLRP